MQGLKIGGQYVQSLSGPSTYAILLPPNGSNLPIQLLFGDVHRSFNNPCQEDEKNSYYTHSDEFLGLLNEVAKVYPVDFYTESAYGYFMDRAHKVQDGYLFSKLLIKMEQCYANRWSYKYEIECPTTYIRWNHVDSRYFEKSVEGYLFQYIREFLIQQILSSKDNELVTHWLSLFEYKYSFNSNELVGYSGLYLSLLVIETIVQYAETMPKCKTLMELSPGAINELYELRMRLDNEPEQKDNIESQMDRVYIRDSGIENHYKSLVNELIDAYFDRIKPETSSLAKQLDKVEGIHINTLKSQLRRIPENSFSDILPSLNDLLSNINLDSLKVIQELLRVPTNDRNYYSRIKCEDMEALRKCCVNLKYFFEDMFSCFLEIYYISRLLQHKNSYLSVGYFGNHHTQNIIEYFTTNMNYTVLASSENVSTLIHPDDIPRCIRLDDIDLDAILRNHLTPERKRRALTHIIGLNSERKSRLESFAREYFKEKQKAGKIRDALPIPQFLKE